MVHCELLPGYTNSRVKWLFFTKFCQLKFNRSENCLQPLSRSCSKPKLTSQQRRPLGLCPPSVPNSAPNSWLPDPAPRSPSCYSAPAGVEAGVDAGAGVGAGGGLLHASAHQWDHPTGLPRHSFALYVRSNYSVQAQLTTLWLVIYREWGVAFSSTQTGYCMHILKTFWVVFNNIFIKNNVYKVIFSFEIQLFLHVPAS